VALPTLNNNAAIKVTIRVFIKIPPARFGGRL